VDRSSGKGPEGLTLLPLVSSKQDDHPCFQCAKCCKYVAIEIDAPTTPTEYDQIVWYLYHQKVSVFVDWDGVWHVKFDADCDNLTPTGLCAVYDHRPAICKDFDWRECENHMTPEDGPPDQWLWWTADEFLAWFAKQRPKAYARYQAWLRAKHAKGEEPELLRISRAAKPARGRRERVRSRAWKKPRELSTPNG
jgi:Fe-S-cluster containining protein